VWSPPVRLDWSLFAPAARREDPVVELSRSVVIARAGKDVFAYLADARNDPEWCPKVLSVDQIEGDGPGPGARYRVTHRPIPVRPAREMDHTCLSWTPPTRIQWREDDGTDVLIVTYTLEALSGATRLTQRSDAALRAPRVFHPLMRAGIGHDISRQLKTLKAKLEAQQL
jgi:polyketide cyclase/dehydrase/lipid transport protein